MEQLSFTDLEIEIRRKTRKTRLERLTQRLESLIPWKDLLDLIRPHYFVSGRRGRQPYALELMLRIHLLQITYNLSDPQMEDCNDNPSVPPYSRKTRSRSADHADSECQN